MLKEAICKSYFSLIRKKKHKSKKASSLCLNKNLFSQKLSTGNMARSAWFQRPAPLGQNLADITILLMLTTIFSASRVGRGVTSRPEKRWKGWRAFHSPLTFSVSISPSLYLQPFFAPRWRAVTHRKLLIVRPLQVLASICTVAHSCAAVLLAHIWRFNTFSVKRGFLFQENLPQVNNKSNNRYGRMASSISHIHLRKTPQETFRKRKKIILKRHWMNNQITSGFFVYFLYLEEC